MMDRTYKDVLRPFLNPVLFPSDNPQDWVDQIIFQIGNTLLNSHMKVQAVVLPGKHQLTMEMFLLNSSHAVYKHGNNGFELDFSQIRTPYGSVKVFYSGLQNGMFDGMWMLEFSKDDDHKTSEMFLHYAESFGADAAIVHLLNSICGLHLNWFELQFDCWGTYEVGLRYQLNTLLYRLSAPEDLVPRSFKLPNFCADRDAFFKYVVRPLRPAARRNVALPEGAFGVAWLLKELYASGVKYPDLQYKSVWRTRPVASRVEVPGDS